MDISVVIPLYNEEESLPELYAWIERVMKENNFSAFIPNKGNDDAMQLSGANELLYAAKASYLYKAIKTKKLVDSLKQWVCPEK